MLDDFRQQANASEFIDEEESSHLEETGQPRKFLGMTPAQRCVIALMLLLITCLLSTFCLLVTEKIIPPFM
jgi:hypothetical protein